MQYKISRSQKSQGRIWAALRAVQEQQFPLVLPDGMSGSDMDSRLADVNYGTGLGLNLKSNTSREPKELVPEDANQKQSKHMTSRFSAPSQKVKLLRKLAQEGKAELQREEVHGTRQVIWGWDSDDGYLRDSELPADQPRAVPGIEEADLGRSPEYGIVDTWERLEEQETADHASHQDVWDPDEVAQTQSLQAASVTEWDADDGILLRDAELPVDQANAAASAEQTELGSCIDPEAVNTGQSSQHQEAAVEDSSVGDATGMPPNQDISPTPCDHIPHNDSTSHLRDVFAKYHL
jgi:hypothetical protein